MTGAIAYSVMTICENNHAAIRGAKQWSVSLIAADKPGKLKIQIYNDFVTFG
ncbi:MAG: hypothetical protein DHS20C08_02500 [Rhodomicrobium sp.]|nr:MAG: hypothetical protein DHS20C08_02500 [Rhodomicrobium sp.]